MKRGKNGLEIAQWALGGLLGAVFLWGYVGSKNKVETQVAQNLAVQRSYGPQKSIEVRLVPSNTPGLHNRLEMKFDAGAQDSFALSAPVWYEIQDIKMPSVLPVENANLKQVTVTFPKPEALVGKLLRIYCQNPYTLERKVLYEERLAER